MRGLPGILSLFSNEFDKFNGKRARMLDSDSSMMILRFSASKRQDFAIYTRCCYGHYNITLLVCNPLVV